MMIPHTCAGLSMQSGWFADGRAALSIVSTLTHKPGVGAVQNVLSG